MSETRKAPTPLPGSTSSDETSFWTPALGWSGTVVISVKGWDDLLSDPAMRDGQARLVFVSYELLHKVLAPNRMEIVKAMMGAGPLSIREVARRVGRDFKGVHTDVTTLLDNGVLHRVEDGGIVFPYDTIHFDFEITGLAQSAA